jgi:hypothetical protein
MRFLRGIDDLAPILRGVPALEGKLLELAIAAVAQLQS